MSFFTSICFACMSAGQSVHLSSASENIGLLHGLAPRTALFITCCYAQASTTGPLHPCSVLRVKLQPVSWRVPGGSSGGKWALNACAPAIPAATDTAAPPPQHSKRLGTVLRRLHSARIDRDFAQIHFLQKEVAAIYPGLNIPFVPAPVVKVPDLTRQQKGVVSAVVRGMIKGMAVPRWQRQAVQASIHVVRTVPHTLRKVVEKHQNKNAWDADRPECCCNEQHRKIWEAVGRVTTIEGHFALLPVALQHQGAVVRSGDPIPQHGQKSRSDCISDLERLASALHTHMSDTDKTLPRAMFTESGDTLRSVRESVDLLWSVAYVRIVDKHSSAMWAFCKQWAWDQHIKFVTDEGYARVAETPD